MKKTLFIILALCSMSYGLSGYSMYKIYKSGDTVTAINLDSNFVRGSSWSNKLADTIDRNFIRWYDFNSHDSTLRYFKVDTIRSNPHVDSIAGNTIITGSPTITGTLTADTLKLTNGINATGGSFSSTVKADSVNSTKNITAPSVKLTNLTSGYFPYQNNSGILANGPIFTNGTNVSVCKSSVEAWSSGYRALQVGANTAIFSDGTESGTADTWFSTNLYFDGAWKPQMSGQSQMLSFGSSGVVYQHDTGVVADVGFTPTTRFSWTLANGLNVTNKIVSSDSIKGVTGTFSGALSSTTVNTGLGNNELYPMDQAVLTTSAPTFTTVNTGQGANELYAMDQNVRTTSDVTFKDVNITDLTSGYIPYKSTNLENGPIFTNGTNTAIGKSSVEAWSSGYRTLQVGANTAIFSDVTESGTSNTWFSTNLYFDGAWKPQMSGQSQMLSFGSSGVVYQHDTGVVADVGFTPTTRFSWTLSGGLNVASKGTFTNIASGDTVSGKKGLFDSIKIGDGSYLKTYLDTTFYDSLYEGSTYLNQRALARIVQIGKIVTLYQPSCYTTTSGGFMTLRGLPTKFKPNTSITLSSVVRNNASITLGQISVGGTNSYLYLFKSDGENLDAGNSGASLTCITWMID